MRIACNHDNQIHASSFACLILPKSEVHAIQQQRWSSRVRCHFVQHNTPLQLLQQRQWQWQPDGEIIPVKDQRRTMAGHNKWSKICHKKCAKDVNRALVFSKASRKIIAASRACGGDMANLRLQSAIANAKALRLPKDRMQDAIAKGAGGGGGGSGTSQDLENLRFDAMMNFVGSHVGCIITALTDNRNRTVQNVRAIVTKQGGEFLPTDKLSYLFVQVGLVLVECVEDEDALLLCALDAGAMNVEPEDKADPSVGVDNLEASSDSHPDRDNNKKKFIVTTEEKDLWQVVTSLRDGAFHVSQFEHRYVLVDQDHGGVSLSEEGAERLELFLEKLDENEDVTNVYHSAAS